MLASTARERTDERRNALTGNGASLDMAEPSLSERLRLLHEDLRAMLVRTSDQAIVEDLGAVVHELGLIRLLMDSPTPESRRAHLRVRESIGTALIVDDREVDAAIIDISVGGVGLVVDERLPVGKVLQVAVPPVGWIEAVVVAAEDDRLHIRFWTERTTDEQRRAILDLVLRHYD